MNGRILKLEVPEHQAVQELLTWHASGKLAPDEAERVARHVRSCAQCRQDLQWERELLDEARREPQYDVVAGEADTFGVDAALGRLMPRLGEQDAVPAPKPQRADAATESAATQASAGASAAAGLTLPGRESPWWRTLAANEPRWLRWAALAQCVIIAGLALLLARPGPETAGEYRAMGASDASQMTGSADGTSNGAAGVGNVVVIFAPGASEQDLRRVLQAQDARIVDGPTVTGAYVLSIPAAERARALSALRANDAIKLAEPLDAGGKP